MEKLVGQEVSLADLCSAALRLSDNVAGNKVLESSGGPEGLTGYLRSIGDTVTRLDRQEPELNQAAPGDPRDTTTPAAIAGSLLRLVFGEALSPSSRYQLRAWLVADEVGGPLLRAGVPGDWVIGDRTGVGGHGSRGVVAVMWPPGQAPIVAAIYVTSTDATMDQRNHCLAAQGPVGRPPHSVAALSRQLQLSSGIVEQAEPRSRQGGMVLWRVITLFPSPEPDRASRPRSRRILRHRNRTVYKTTCREPASPIRCPPP